MTTTEQVLWQQQLLEPKNLHQYFRIMPDGKVARIIRLAFTYGLCLGGGINQRAYLHRFCFNSLSECISAFNSVQSVYDIPDEWVATRPEWRLMGIHDLTNIIDHEIIDFQDINSCKNVQDAIDKGIYNQKNFMIWLNKQGKNLDDTDSGIKDFYSRLPK